MKILYFYFTALFTIILSVTSYAQTHDHSKMNMNMATSKTETFKVWGNCDECKIRIEETVKADGAIGANWNSKTKILAVTYDPAKTSVESISKKLAAAGHDTEKFKADDKVYNALPGCCKYDRMAATMAADYTCPMHADVHSDNPGKCPKCGMALVKKEMDKPDSDKSMHRMEDMHKN